MSGLIFLTALALCLWGCAWLAKTLGNLVPNLAWRSAVKFGVFLALLASTFADEVIGKYQFEALCKANGIERADVSKARGKRVKLELGDSRPLSGTLMPGSIKEHVYRDVDSGEVVIHHKDYFAYGGWLMRHTPLSMGSRRPMLFSGGCTDNYLARDAILTRENISLVN
ncbi:hypothetical protein [Xylophilus ampelinus]|uniref:hypothetical protein n=1 Tax=Xylophilus ampelinus TaxID=54067 RepID=UPI0011B42CE6|nr:hypothetical protein [Xylophilus ampelinus]MCS4511045.1 hypothetical protein [Xylophilus ampelinus]